MARKRGRPKGSKNKSTLIKEGLLDPTTGEVISPKDPRPDDEILGEIKGRFDVYHRMMMGAIDGSMNALIVSGASGVGKSYTSEWVLGNKAEEDPSFKYHVLRGAVSPVELYKLAYLNRNEGNVIVLDDADAIFDDEDGLNLLKGLLDTSQIRTVSWQKDSNTLRANDDQAETPKSFRYRGSMVFLTNKDFQAVIDGRSVSRKNAEHMAALMSRAIYLDLKMHHRREVTLWVRHIVLHNKILRKMGVSKEDEETAVEWLVKHRDDLREISIRTALKVGRFMLVDPINWERDAKVTLLHNS